LLCPEAIAREREETERPPLQPDDALALRAVLLQLLRSTVRQGQFERPSTGIGTYYAITFSARLIDGHVVIAASGHVKDLIVLQMVLLLHEVGLKNVRECTAPDCQRLFVKVYRREFCSVQCQKRINTRNQRQIAREQKERLARRRRQRRKKGG
jgi:hypothetical protein